MATPLTMLARVKMDKAITLPADSKASEDMVDSFGFPHPPYPVQSALMKEVYSTLDRGGVAILESPTGTGKTLSLLCPALAWMRRREQDLLAEALSTYDTGEGAGPSGDEDWARQHHRDMARSMAKVRWHRRRERREARRLRIQRAATVTERGAIRNAKVRRVDHSALLVVTGEAEFSLEGPPVLPNLDDLTEVDAQAAMEDEVFEEKLQIVFCSRTHTQLAQVLREIQRIDAKAVPEQLAVVTLGARTNLCVNDSVRARAHGAMHLNDLCKKATEKSKQVGGCVLKKQSQNMTDACLTDILDIEAMVQRGRAPLGGGCPYYGSRHAAREADVLLVPYASLVNNETRRKLGIRTAGNVFIFDEAHNLLEAISDANSVTFTALQARAAVDDLDVYASKYEARLTSGNAMRLRQLRQLCNLLHRHLATLENSSAQTVGAFLVGLGADHFDLPDLSRFLETTELPRKVRGYVESVRVHGTPRPSSSSSVYGIAELLLALMGSTASDRILCQAKTAEDETASVRYLSLDAEARFRDLFSSARSVIFAGGTLEPRSEFAPLYSGVQPGVTTSNGNRVSHFSGKHVVPSSHIFARYVTHGPARNQLDFRKDMRSKAEQLSELKSIMASAAGLTPGGAIFFFPSFEYLSAVTPSTGSRIGGRAVFAESRGGGEAGSASAFRDFAATVRRDGGAVLLAVSGAKWSEGIDFKDDLCRLVVVVGLPYPNASDMGLIEKMRFLDRCRAEGLPGLTGREFYTARCMKAVNQCVGRSIRHAGDWAAILMLDHRYAHSGINSSVSLWLRDRAVPASYVDAERDLRSFFASRLPAKVPAHVATLGIAASVAAAAAA